MTNFMRPNHTKKSNCSNKNDIARSRLRMLAVGTFYFGHLLVLQMTILVPQESRSKSKKVGHQNRTVISAPRFHALFGQTEQKRSAKSACQKFARLTLLSFVNTVSLMLNYSAFSPCHLDITVLCEKSVHKKNVLCPVLQLIVSVV